MLDWMLHMVMVALPSAKPNRVSRKDGIVRPTSDWVEALNNRHDASAMLRISIPMLDASWLVVVLAAARRSRLDLPNLVYAYVSVVLIHPNSRSVCHNTIRRQSNYKRMAVRVVHMGDLVADQTWPWPTRTFVVRIGCIRLGTVRLASCVDCAMSIGSHYNMDLCRLVRLFRRPTVFWREHNLCTNWDCSHRSVSIQQQQQPALRHGDARTRQQMEADRLD